MGETRQSRRTGYIANPLASRERAVTLALQLRLMDFSPRAVAFELCHHHGLTEAEAARIVREAAARARRATGAATTGATTTGARGGRRWLDLGGAGRAADATTRARHAARS